MIVRFQRSDFEIRGQGNRRYSEILISELSLCSELVYVRGRIRTPGYEFVLFILPDTNSYFLHFWI